MSRYDERQARKGWAAVLLVSIPATFGYLAIWMTTTDLARHEQLAATAGLSFFHIFVGALAYAAGSDS